MKRRRAWILSGVVAVVFIILLTSCGGGGGSIGNGTVTPQVSVAVSPTVATMTAGQGTQQFTATVTNSADKSVTWKVDGTTSGNSTVGTISASGLYTPPATAPASDPVTVTATSNADATKSASATVTIQAAQSKLAVTVSPASSTVNVNGTVALSATITGGSGNATVAWTMSPASGSLSPTSGLTTTYTAAATAPSPNTVTITATATDGSQTATGTAMVTIKRTQITIGIKVPSIGFSLDYGDDLLNATITCTGCEVGDTVNGQFFSLSGSPVEQQAIQNPNAVSSWVETFNFIGTLYVPTLIKIWVSGTDGVISNALWLTFNGSQNVTTQDQTTGEVYYYSAGNGTSASGEILKFKPDGTPDGSYGTANGAATIAADNNLIYLTQPAPLSSGVNGIAVYNANTGASIKLIPLTDGEPFAISAAGGLVCTTIPTGNDSPNTMDAVDCTNSGGTFTVPGVPAGSQPVAIKVFDSSHFAFYGRGDRTLRWYTVTGTTATAAGTLQLSELTATDTNYWKTYPATGEWDLVQVGNVLGVMGAVVNTDGTIGETLVVVDNATQTVTQHINLPDGTIHIAADASNSAFTAEYKDTSVSPPVMRLERIFAGTGNQTLLQSTSSVVPGAGFLVPQNILICGGGKCDPQPNQ